MAKLKIELESGEDILEADEAIFKALNLHRTGDAHLRESFDDPAMVDLSQRLFKLHEDVYKDLIQEINAALDEDYTDGN